MKRKSIYILIISVVILSLFLANIPVSAATTGDQTVFLKGSDLKYFLQHSIKKFELSTVTSYTAEGSTYLLYDPVPDAKYQILWSESLGDPVWLIVNCPDISVIKNRPLRISITFGLDKTIKTFNTSIAKRFISGNGDGSSTYAGATFNSSLSLNLWGSNTNTNVLRLISDKQTYGTNYSPVTRAYPYLSVRTDRNTGFQYVEGFEGSTFNANSYECSIDFNVRSDGANAAEWFSADEFQVVYNSGVYTGGALMFLFDPIQMVTTQPYNNNIEDILTNQTDSDKEIIDNLNGLINSGSGSVGSNYDSLEQMGQALDNSVVKPSLNISGAFGLGEQLALGLSDISTGFAPFYDNSYIILIVGAAVPVILISYLVFGKKG